MAEQLEYGIKLKSLKINNFRCFEKLEVFFDDKLTVFIAENGGGKTALLDAVAEGLKAYLFALGIDKSPCSFNAKDVTIGRDNKTENDIEVELAYPVQLGGYVNEKGIPDQVNEDDSTAAYSTTSKKSGHQKAEEETREVEEQEFEMDSRTEKDVKLHVDISTDGDSEYELSRSSVVDSFQRHAAQRINKESGENIILPVLLYHGGNSPQFEETSANSFKSRTTTIYENALSSSRMNFSTFYHWFETRYRLFLQEKANDPTVELDKFDPELSKIKWAVEEIMNDDPNDKNYDNLRVLYTKQGAKMVLGKKNDRGTYDDIEIKQLSSGEKALFALVADLGFRLLNACPINKEDANVENPVENVRVDTISGKGIVLIDEVDLHLHPKWQRKVVGKLMNIFPDVQWVMTTHSPLILGGLPSKHIKITDQGKIYDVEATYGRDIDDILEIVMQVDAGAFTQKINKIAGLISLGELEVAEQKLLEMKKEIDNAGDKSDEHPDVLRMKTLLDRKKVLGR